MNHVRGTIHGKVIELSEEIGLPDGQEVTVLVRPVGRAAEEETLPSGEGLRHAFGAWADDAEQLDKYLDWNQQRREISRPEIDS